MDSCGDGLCLSLFILQMNINIINSNIKNINVHIDNVNKMDYSEISRVTGRMKEMKYQAPGTCPVCGERLAVTRLSCGRCNSRLEGDFEFCKFSRLPVEQREFIEVFIKCRGNIKDVEKELGISYPTVRNRLDGVIEALGHRVDKNEGAVGNENENRQTVLKALENGEITAEEAARQLRKGSGPNR
jgi:hypothetical protein